MYHKKTTTRIVHAQHDTLQMSNDWIVHHSSLEEGFRASTIRHTTIDLTISSNPNAVYTCQIKGCGNRFVAGNYLFKGEASAAQALLEAVLREGCPMCVRCAVEVCKEVFRRTEKNLTEFNVQK